ncbi:MAG: hypothetical protein MUF86_15425 [Akkermansiaceae bacterium]|nr:hypothetical protein [Akkermansiaceae bacterium]
MNALKWIPILLLAVIAIHMQPLRAQEAKPTNSKYVAEKKVDLMNLTIPGYIDFCKSMIKSSEEDKDAFAKSSKTMLIGMLGWEKRHAEQRVFDIDPM